MTTLTGSPSQTYGSSDGVGTAASFFYPYGVAMNAAGTVALIVRREASTSASQLSLFFMHYPGLSSSLQADRNNLIVRYIDVASSLVTTFAGSGLPGYADGAGTSARFSAVWGAAMDATFSVAIIVSVASGVTYAYCRFEVHFVFLPPAQYRSTPAPAIAGR